MNRENDGQQFSKIVPAQNILTNTLKIKMNKILY